MSSPKLDFSLSFLLLQISVAVPRGRCIETPADECPSTGLQWFRHLSSPLELMRSECSCSENKGIQAEMVCDAVHLTSALERLSGSHNTRGQWSRALLLYVSTSVPDSSLVAHHGSQHTSHASVEGLLPIGQRVRLLIPDATPEGFCSIGRCDGQRAG
jgi:hypothetical protein